MGATRTAVVPSLTIPSGSSSPSISASRHRPALPLPTLTAPRLDRTIYGFALMDNRGRVTDAVIQRALAWEANSSLGIRAHDGVILIKADLRGTFRLSKDGQLRLPPAVRRWCGLAPGSGVLLAANAADGLLVVYPPAKLDAALAPATELLYRGDAS